MGWLESAGSQISETWDETTEAVGKWLEVADEAADLDYDVGLDHITASGTLRDVIEIAVSAGQVDAGLLALLEGSTSDNTVTMTYDFMAGTFEVLAPELELVDFEAGGVGIDRALLHGVRIAAQSGKIGLKGQAGTRAEVSADQLHAEGVSFVGEDGPVRIAEAHIDGFAFQAASKGAELLDRKGITAALQAQAIAARHILGDGTELESAELTGLAATLDGAEETANVTLDQLNARGFSRGGVGLGDASVTGARIDVSNKGGGLPMLDQQPDHLAGGVNVEAAAITDFHHPTANVGAAVLDQFSATYGQGDTQAGARSLTASGVESEWAKADSVSADGLSASLTADARVSGHVGSSSVDGLQAFGATAGKAGASDVDFAHAADRTDLTIGSVSGDQAAYGDLVSARSISAEGTRVGLHGDDIDASVESLEARKVAAESFRTDALFARDADVAIDPTSKTARLGAAAAFGSTVADRVGIDKAEVSGLSARLTDDRTQVQVARGEASGVRDRPTGTTVGAAQLQSLALDATRDATTADVEHLAMKDAKFAVDGGAPADGGPGLDMDALIRSGSQRVDSADVSARIGLNAGEYGPATIRQGSELRADVGVRHNQFTKLNAQVSKGVDLPGWIEGKGAYLDDKGRLQANLGGFFDMTAGGYVNDALGLEGERMPSVSRLGGAVASQMSKPETGGGGGPSPVNLDDHDVRARVGLSPGKLDAGLGSASLQRDRATDNVVDVHSRGGKGLSVHAARLLAGSVDVNGGAQAGRTAIDGPEMVLGGRGDLTASADGVSTRDLRVGGISARQADVSDVRVHQGTRGDVNGSVKSADVRDLHYRGAGVAPAASGTSDASAGTRHEVRRGDSLGAIARQYGTTVDAIARANGIADVNKIFPGQQLRIP